MDGLLLDTEDKYTQVVNTLLAKYNKGPLPWSVKAQLQGRPAPAAHDLFHAWAQLPAEVTKEQWAADVAVMQSKLFPSAAPLQGVAELLRKLQDAKVKGRNAEKVHLALATSSHTANFKLKSDHLTQLFEVFTPERRVLGDDPRIPNGRGKPAPDIYLLALDQVNKTLPEGEEKIKPSECLVFEDSVSGVEAGRRAGMRVVWCPHPELKMEMAGRDAEILAGKADPGMDKDGAVGEIGDGWAAYLPTLENFPYEAYGMKVKN